MAEGRKTGGRTKGTPNRSTADVVARLAELGCDPIEGMALIALDPTNPPELRGKMFAELAGYVAPKRKAIEQSDRRLDAHGSRDDPRESQCLTPR